MTEEVAVRNPDGTFVAGKSGNPLGRPKGKKNQLTELKQDLEIAVRKSLSVDRIKRIVEKVAQMAEDGDVKAAKLILDKVISNATETDDTDVKGVQKIEIHIDNATFAAKREHIPQPAVDAEFTEVKQ